MAEHLVTFAEIQRLYLYAFGCSLPSTMPYKEAGQKVYDKMGEAEFVFNLELIRTEVKVNVEDEEETELEPEEILEEIKEAKVE